MVPVRHDSIRADTCFPTSGEICGPKRASIGRTGGRGFDSHQGCHPFFGISDMIVICQENNMCSLKFEDISGL